jgi:hypothetical protein
MNNFYYDRREIETTEPLVNLHFLAEESHVAEIDSERKYLKKKNS